MNTKTRMERFAKAWTRLYPSYAEVIARCRDLDLGDGNLGEVVAQAIVDLGHDAPLDELEREVRYVMQP